MIKGTVDLEVYVDGHLLDPAPSQKLYNHSPDGFAWGYGGSGPAQLALALLLKFTHDKNYALAKYQQFKSEVIAGLDKPKFVISSGVVANWIKAHK